jgi:cobalt-zinc-cadmium efflux system protein
VADTIKSVPGVKDIHDFHIWTITSGIYALSAHLLLDDQQLSHTRQIIDAVNHELAERYAITHTTLQVECNRCESCAQGFVCELSRPGHPLTEHDEEERAV